MPESVAGGVERASMARLLGLGAALMVALLIGLVLAPRAAQAAEFSVNSTGDAPDQNTATDNTCSTGNFVGIPGEGG